MEVSTIPVEELIGSTHRSGCPTTPATAPSRSLSNRLPPPDAGEPADLRKERADRAEKAKAAKGWSKSRFESCQKRPSDLVLHDKQGSQSIGRLWFDQWILGFAYDGSRRVDYISSIENIRVQAPPTMTPPSGASGSTSHTPSMPPPTTGTPR